MNKILVFLFIFLTFSDICFASSGQEEANPYATLVLFLVIFGIFYFLLIRPQTKRAKELKEMIASLKKGDRVVTIGGIIGEVVEVRDKTLILKLNDRTRVEILKSAVSTKLTDDINTRKS